MTRRRQSLWSVMLVTVVAIGVTLSLTLDVRPTAAGTPQPLPTVLPTTLLPLAEDAARSANAAQPFVDVAFPAASPFRFAGDGAAQARAVDCLAAAMLYEAGDSTDDQRPVAQVILNRARHPAFPATVCGVVFQGAQRRTGCQFTFTCDGSLRRRYSADAWTRARGVAVAALSGDVDARVGLATHYHTDWVRPYWSDSLDKLAQVGTHLFFRWRGYWGTPPAFRAAAGAGEPLIGRLAAISPAHAAAPDAAAALLPDAEFSAEAVDQASTAAIRQIIPQAERRLGDTIILTLDRSLSADMFPAMAASACGQRSYCKVMGWTNPALSPASEDMSDAERAAMSFSFLRDQQRNLERALWNCTEFPRESRGQCMRR